VRVAVKATTAQGKAPPRKRGGLGGRDEGLIELMANTSWDAAAAMMGRRGYEVQNATAQMQVVANAYGVQSAARGRGGGRR